MYVCMYVCMYITRYISVCEWGYVDTYMCKELSILISPPQVSEFNSSEFLTGLRSKAASHVKTLTQRLQNTFVEEIDLNIWRRLMMMS